MRDSKGWSFHLVVAGPMSTREDDRRIRCGLMPLISGWDEVESTPRQTQLRLR